MKASNYISILKTQKKLIVMSSLVALMIVIHSCSDFPTSTKGNEPAKKEVDTSALPIEFSPNIPVDVNPAIQNQLKADGNIYELNKVFNNFSWQALVAIQWPRDADGNPKPNFTDPGTSTWLGWKEAFQVYRSDGKQPAPWGSPRTASGLGLHSDILTDNDSRVVLSSKTPTHPSNNIADEVDQAFAGKLFDQNGNVVVYEVLMNESEFNYINDNGLYNINGQIAFAASNPVANFPTGIYGTDSVGATEIKFAWKIMEPGDITERYYTDEGYIINESTGKLEKETLGMIGMHISQKTPTGKQWVWSTFEHIDNLDENVMMVNNKETPIHPTLTDPACEICPVNIDYTHNETSYTYNQTSHGNYWTVDPDPKNSEYYTNTNILKTQSKRMVDIPVRVKNVNKAMQDYFKSINSVWQYYQLIDTQYPLDQDALPTPDGADDYVIPNSVTNKPGGNANIALLTNISMETFFQDGNQSASNLMEDNTPTKIEIFGTESCMGCHSSAGLYSGVTNDSGKIKATQSGQLSGDFSWLMGKAVWLDNIPVDSDQ